jgi:hypothetical protein
VIRRGDSLWSAVLFAASWCWLSAFRHYGFQVEDEGTLLFQLARFASGQSPYIDFHTGYTPGFFALGALALEAAGFASSSLRLVLALLHAGVAVTLWALGRSIVGRGPALLAPLVWLVWLPLYPGGFASFNVPYPAWFAAATWVAAAWLACGWVERGGLARLAVAGVVAALAFSIKLNAGAYMLAALTWVVASASRGERLQDRAAVIVASAAMAVGVWLALGMPPGGLDVGIHVLPCVGLAVLWSGPGAGRLAGAAAPRALTALTVLALGFLLPTLYWAVPLWWQLGSAHFATDVLLLGSGAAELYYTGHPAPEAYAAGAVVAAIGAAVAGRLVAAGRVAAQPLFSAGALLAMSGLALATSLSPMPEGWRASVTFQMENAAFWCVPLVHYAALLAVARIFMREPDSRDRRFVTLVPLAVAMYAQLFPRIDFMHVMMSVPLSAVVAQTLALRLLGWWSRGRWPGPDRRKVMIRAAAAALVALILVPRLSMSMEWPLRWALRGGELTLHGARLALGVEREAADDLRAFADTAEFLRRHTDAGEAVLAFPALTGLLFAADRPSPVAHDYWYPGRPDHVDEAAMLEALRDSPPRVIVCLNTDWNFFYGAPEYFRITREFVTSRYWLVQRRGRYDVLMRDDALSTAGLEAVTAGTAWLADDRAPGRVPEAPGPVPVEPLLSHRWQAVHRWLKGLRPGDAARPRLPEDRRGRLLAIRALRDGRDLRSAPWLVAAMRSDDRRQRRDARTALVLQAENWPALRYRWAGDVQADDIVAYLDPVREELQALHDQADTALVRVAETVDAIYDEYRNDIENGPVSAR